MHVVFSVGWLGSVVPYLALAIAGLTTQDFQTQRAAYLSMQFIGWYVIVPLSIAALASGLVQALSTQWGLARYWWVLAKLLLTIVGVVILLVHMREVSSAARLLKEQTLSSPSFRPELIHAGGGLLVLVAVTVLSVFKPWGMTSYGRRRASQSRPQSPPKDETSLVRKPAFPRNKPRWALIAGIHAIVLGLLAAIQHITGLLHH
jgi:hypothetical protein